MYASRSAKRKAPRPIARRPVKPVPTPKSMRPGASLLSEASAPGRCGWTDQHTRTEADARGLHGDDEILTLHGAEGTECISNERRARHGARMARGRAQDHRVARERDGPAIVRVQPLVLPHARVSPVAGLTPKPSNVATS